MNDALERAESAAVSHLAVKRRREAGADRPFSVMSREHQLNVKLEILKGKHVATTTSLALLAKGPPDFILSFKPLTNDTAAMYKPFLIFLLAMPLAARAGCDPTGSYLQGTPDAYTGTFKVSRVGDEYELQLDTYGQKLSDGNRTFGAVRGKFALSENGCAGAYLAPDDECAVFIGFNRRGAEVHQFGSCLFGFGVSAGGIYRRLRAHGGLRGLTQSSSGMPAASADR